MTARPLTYAVAAGLFATLALAGCKKDEPDLAATPPAGTEPMAPAPAPMPSEPLGMPAETAVNVTAVTLGREAGADKRIATPMSTFAAGDPIVVSVATDGAASNATISARLVYQDGQTAGEQQQTVNTTGMETTNFTFTNANPWPAGSYTAAFTCQASADQPETDDDIEFLTTADTSVSAGQTTELAFGESMFSAESRKSGSVG